MPRSRSRGVSLFTPATRKRWRAKDAEAVLGRLDSSGLSVPQFAARENLQTQRLYRWRAELRSGRRKGPAFVEIKPTASVTIEVVLRSGHVVRVPDGFGEAALRRLVAVLDERGLQC
jgi:hypothetical protein